MDQDQIKCPGASSHSHQQLPRFTARRLDSRAPRSRPVASLLPSVATGPMSLFRVPAAAGVLCSAIVLLTAVLATHANNTTTTTPPMPSSSSSCEPAMCGGLRIKYPFWLGGTHPQECGYRAFQVSCDRNVTASLQNSISTYQILDISYPESTFRVTNPELSDGTCDFELLPVNVSSDLGLAPFGISSANQELFFLYDCTGLQARPPTWAPVNCANDELLNNSFAWLAGGYKPDDKRAPTPGNCTVSTVPVLGYPGATGANYRRLIKGGFRLEYTADDCTACRETGGLCRINTTHDIFECHCADGVSDLFICVDQFITPTEKGVGRRTQVVERCTSTASTMASLNGVAEWGLDVGREMMDSRRAGAPSGVVVASTTCLTRSMRQYLL